MKTILITGGNRGLGFELAAQLLESNSVGHLVITCRTDQTCELARSKFSERLFNKDLPVTFISMDLSKNDQVYNAAAELKANGIKIDVLVNNAAVLHRFSYSSIGQDTININFLHTKLFTDILLHDDIFNDNFRIINISAMLGNMTIIKDKDIKKTLKECLPENIEMISKELIYKIDNKHQIDEIINKDLAIFSEYALSKLLLNIYTYQLKDNQYIIKKYGAVVAVYPGFIKTDMGTLQAPLEIPEGIKPIYDLIQLSDIDFKKYNGKFLERHLNELNIYDESIQFLEYKI